MTRRFYVRALAAVAAFNNRRQRKEKTEIDDGVASHVANEYVNEAYNDLVFVDEDNEAAIAKLEQAIEELEAARED